MLDLFEVADSQRLAVGLEQDVLCGAVVQGNARIGEITVIIGGCTLLAAGEYDMLIFEDPSKFSRSILTSIYELTGLKNSGIKIISIAHDVKYKNNDEEFAEN